MYISQLRLSGFRNYASLEYEPSDKITVLFGKNGVGKTSVLEAMHLMCVGRSHRTLSDRDMIAHGADTACAKALARRRDGAHEVEVRLFISQKPQKRVFISGKPASRVLDMMGHITCVMFSPEDMRTLRDGPAARRRFVDMQLGAVKPMYLTALKRYQSALEARNALLKAGAGNMSAAFEKQLDVWDEQLAYAAAPVITERRAFIEKLSRMAAREYASIAEHDSETLCLKYACCAKADGAERESVLRGLACARDEDARRQFTSFGPHRDDLEITLRGRSLQAYGSQGQLRTAVLSMKLAQIDIIEKEMEDRPTLLLDDVLSELDEKRRAALIERMRDIQTFVTCTDESDAGSVRPDDVIEIGVDDGGHAVMKR